MIATPTTTVSILRGSETNYAGDEVDSDTVHTAGIPASLIEQSRLTTQPVEGGSRTVRRTQLRVPNGTDLTTDDRIKDDRTGETYSVVDVHRPRNAALPFDLTAELLLTS